MEDPKVCSTHECPCGGILVAMKKVGNELILAENKYDLWQCATCGLRYNKEKKK